MHFISITHFFQWKNQEGFLGTREKYHNYLEVTSNSCFLQSEKTWERKFSWALHTNRWPVLRLAAPMPARPASAPVPFSSCCDTAVRDIDPTKKIRKKTMLGIWKLEKVQYEESPFPDINTTNIFLTATMHHPIMVLCLGSTLCQLFIVPSTQVLVVINAVTK